MWVREGSEVGRRVDGGLAVLKKHDHGSSRGRDSGCDRHGLIENGHANPVLWLLRRSEASILA